MKKKRDVFKSFVNEEIPFRLLDDNSLTTSANILSVHCGSDYDVSLMRQVKDGFETINEGDNRPDDPVLVKFYVNTIDETDVTLEVIFDRQANKYCFVEEDVNEENLFCVINRGENTGQLNTHDRALLEAAVEHWLRLTLDEKVKT